MKSIYIKTIPHGKQRYDTCGDWYDENGVQRINISKLNDEDMEFCVALHELIEAYLCQKRGITIEVVDKFDKAWKGKGEPGDNEDAPYHKEHKFATMIEKLMAKELRLNWKKYGDKISNL